MIENLYDVSTSHVRYPKSEIKVWLFTLKAGVTPRDLIMTGYLHGDETMLRYAEWKDDGDRYDKGGWKLEVYRDKEFRKIDYRESSSSLCVDRFVRTLVQDVKRITESMS